MRPEVHELLRIIQLAPAPHEPHQHRYVWDCSCGATGAVRWRKPQDAGADHLTHVDADAAPSRTDPSPAEREWDRIQSLKTSDPILGAVDDSYRLQSGGARINETHSDLWGRS